MRACRVSARVCVAAQPRLAQRQHSLQAPGQLPHALHTYPPYVRHQAPYARRQAPYSTPNARLAPSAGQPTCNPRHAQLAA
eukprot:3312694-Rhodomonas_salina.2